jgi:UDP-N-acetylmuramate--alanine ligase
MDLKDIKKVYFIGIGGIGMSAIARYFLGRGVAVYGYDRTSTPLTRSLEAEGMHVHYHEAIELIPDDIDLAIYTPAVPASHIAFQALRARGIIPKKRSEVLGIISREMKTIAIAGTHGKTTTSSLTTHLLRSSGIDCTAFLGGIAMNPGSNFVQGKSDWVVVEADEFDRSFLHLHPDIAGILSTDADHLDIYGDRQTLLDSGFRAFARQVKPGGSLWLQHQIRDQFADLPCATFGIEAGDCKSAAIHVENGYFVFDYHSPEVTWKGLQLPLPGRHNVENATLAISIARQLGADEASIRQGLLTFRGVKRRFEAIYRDGEIAYFDDYAHHPTELKAAISAARELFPGKWVTGVFQPHLFSRTRDFAAGFAEALDLLDEPILLDIYPARELPIPGVSAEMLQGLMKNTAVRLLKKTQLIEGLQNIQPGVLLTLGAGDIDTFVEPIRQMLEGRAKRQGV